MKKLFAMVLAVLLLIGCFAGCGNMALDFGNFTYEKIHIDTRHYSGCFTIEKWYNNKRGVEVLTKEAGSIFASEGTYILLGGDKDCPLCAGKENDK